MRYPNFAGGSGRSLSPLAALRQTINFYPEHVGDRLVLYPTPGQFAFATSTGVGLRAAFSENGRTFVLMGNQFQELFSNGTLTLRGPLAGLAQDNNPAQIVSNGVGGQLLIASGGNAYCYNLTTNLLSQVLTGGVTMIAMLDTYFLSFNATTGAVRFSAQNDGTTWNVLNTFLRSIAPDPWRAMVVSQGKIWLIGEHTGEVWFDAGGADIPFSPIPSSVFSYGIVGTGFSLVAVGDSVRWLSQTRDGDGIVVGARGYRPERLSDHPTEIAIAGYKRDATISDCEALTYQETGHTFTAFRFPSANATRVYDDATSLWHERGAFDSTANTYGVWSPRTHVAAFGLHLVGDGTTNTINVLDQRYVTEADGSIIRRVIIPPMLFGDGSRVYVDRLQLYLEPGLAPQSPTTGYNPLVSLSLSGNAGKTWSNERFVSAGLVGQYGRKLVWTRCGSSENGMVPRFVFTDPVLWRVVDCLVDGQGFATQAAA